MTIAIFNPEHDLCLAKGRVHYVPPRSAVEFAVRDAHLMQVLYPDALCCSVYAIDHSQFRILNSQLDEVVAWGWDAVVRHQLLKLGVDTALLPSDAELATIRDLQHRTTVLPLQPDCRAIATVAEAEALLQEQPHWVLKAPWSGAGRGLRWIHGSLSPIDRNWIAKTAASQRCVVAEPNRMWSAGRNGAGPHQPADVGLEYMDGRFTGYSLFRTGSGVYKGNILWSDERIEKEFAATDLLPARSRVERWLDAAVWPRYRGPLGIDLMVCPDGAVHVAEMNVRHTMGMVAHEKAKSQSTNH